MEESIHISNDARDASLLDSGGQRVIDHVNSTCESQNAAIDTTCSTSSLCTGTVSPDVPCENETPAKKLNAAGRNVSNKSVDKNCCTVTSEKSDQQGCTDNGNEQSKLINNSNESLVINNIVLQATEAMVADDQMEDNGSSVRDGVNDSTIVDDKIFRNITVPCNSNGADQCMKQETTDEIKKMNDGVVTDMHDNTSENSVEAMVTDDSSENSKEMNNLNTDTQNNMINGNEENRNSLVVDAMNKDQSWKTDRVYQKDLSSLKLLCDYGSDSDEDNDDTKEAVDNSNKSLVRNVPILNPCPAIQQEYRKSEAVAITDSEDESDSSEDEDESSSSTSTATSSSSSDESDSDNTEDECIIVEEKKPSAEVPKTKGELGLEDLPPIEDLHISVPESECVEIGKVLNIVDSLVIVQSLKGCPALDLDSVLFLDNGHNTLGQVFDVFGKVSEACYCVRFNSKDHALQKGINVGMPVYYAPRTEHSKFVFLADLLKMRGSDASWEHNNEPPPKFLDYSDDEEERRARKGDRPPVRDVEPDESQPQAKRYNRKGPKRGGMGRGIPSHSSNRPWSTPFNRYPCPSPPPAFSPRSGPQPLIRPSTFRTPGPPQSHFHNAAAGAPAVPATPSPWAVPPPSMRQDFNVNVGNVPPPQPPFIHNQVGPGGFNMNVGGFGQPPPQPPPQSPQYPPHNVMMPTTIPGAGPFAVDPGNGFKVEAPSSFTPNQPPPFRSEFNLFRPDVRGAFGGGLQTPFGSQGPVFMNRNVPPPQPPQGW